MTIPLVLLTELFPQDSTGSIVEVDLDEETCTPHPYDQDDDEQDPYGFGIEDVKTTKKRRKPPPNGRHKWTMEEEEALELIFRKNLAAKKLPTIMEVHKKIKGSSIHYILNEVSVSAIKK